LGRRRISTSGFAYMATETAVFAVRSAKPCFSWDTCLFFSVLKDVMHFICIMLFCGSDNHVCFRVLHNCVSALTCCVLQDDIYFRQFIFAFTSLHQTLEIQYYVLVCCLL